MRCNVAFRYVHVSHRARITHALPFRRNRLNSGRLTHVIDSDKGHIAIKIFFPTGQLRC